MRRRTVLTYGLGASVLAACGSERGPGPNFEAEGDPSLPSGSSVALTEAERDALLFLREEEKLARDVYDALADFGRPFTNIRHSEQRHMDAVLALLDAYGLDDPAAGLAPGEFRDPALAALYTSLVVEGQADLRSALTVGCRIEELDLRDLALAKADTTRPDVLATYDALLAGSRNHLRAYYGKLRQSGGDYTPQYVDQSTFDAIVSGEGGE